MNSYIINSQSVTAFFIKANSFMQCSTTYVAEHFDEMHIRLAFLFIKNNQMEIFKDVKGYEGIYQVSNFGRVKSLERKVRHSQGGYKIVKEKIMKSASVSRGYLSVDLSKNGESKNFLIHRLILIAFLFNPENKRTVNHINGIKTDNRLSNLEWMTDSENTCHAYKIGLKTNIGENHILSKLKNIEVTQIKDLLRCGRFKQYEIAKFYGISKYTVSLISCGKIWKHIK
jgi:hypothetical protein